MAQACTTSLPAFSTAAWVSCHQRCANAGLRALPTAASNSGAITQSAALTVTGATSLNAGAAPITLSAAANNFQSVALANSGANDVTLVDTNALTLAASSVGRDLALTTGGTLSQTAALVVQHFQRTLGAGGLPTQNE